MPTFTLSAARRRSVAVATRLLGRYRRDARGVAAIEMAFIFPMMLVVYFGLVDVTNLLSANRRVTLTASTLADLVTQAPGTVTKADLNGFFNAASPIMDPFSATGVSLELYDYTKDGAGAKLSWQHKNTGANCGAAPGVTSQITNLMAEGNDVVLARVCYNWQPITGQIFGSTAFKIEDQLILRPRQSATMLCSNC